MSDPSTKVGKRPGIGVYVQASAIDGGRSNLKNAEVRAYMASLALLYDVSPHFSFDFVHIDGLTVRFLKMSSLFEAHPHAIESNVVTLEEPPVGLNFRGTVAPGKCDGKIYHRLETIVDPTHPSWNFHQQVTKWEESIGLFSASAPQSSFGSAKSWMAWVETKMPYDQYERKLRLIFGQFAGNELSRKSEKGLADLEITRVAGGEGGDEIHVTLLDSETHKIGIRAAFTFDQFARALMSEKGIQGRVIRWTMAEKK